MNACEIFQNIAGEVWDRISRNTIRGTRQSEIVFTETIIDIIQNYLEESHSFEVFVQKAKNEVNSGADLEIYLQSDYNQFYRVMLQAKTVELDGNFINIDKNSGSTGRRQYDSLIDYGSKAECPVYYLFYNGIPDFHKTFNDCSGEYNERQLGCAILIAEDVKKHCETNNTGKILGLPTDKPLGTPWRFLTCCENPIVNPTNFKRYSREEIDMDPYFKKLFTSVPPIGFIQIGRQPKVYQLEALNRRIHESGWNPISRIIIGKKKMYLSEGLLKQNW